MSPTSHPPSLAPAPSSGLGLGDIYYVIFRHKWKILCCATLGFIGAAITYTLKPVTYQSDAKLFVRYVVSEKQISPVGSDAMAKSPDHGGETIMQSEIQILTSADLAKRVAETIGPEKILAKSKGGKDLNRAVAMIRRGLTVDVPWSSTVMQISFTHQDPTVVQPVLTELIRQYFQMHKEVHESSGILGDFLTQETDQLRARLQQTEDDLRKARAKANIVGSVEDAKRGFTQQITQIRQEIFTTQAQLAEKNAAWQELAKLAATPAVPGPKDEKAGAPAVVPQDKIDEYQSYRTRIAFLQKNEQELSLQFTPENERMQELHRQLTAAQNAKRELEERYPQLVSVPTATVGVGSTEAATKALDYASAAADAAALQAKIKVLNTQLEQVSAEAAKVDEMQLQISELQRKLDLDQANYRLFSASLEQSRVDEALGNGRVSNIVTIQSPSAPSVDIANNNKLLGEIAGGGIALGLAWAFLIEMYLDRSVKRPVDVERLFGLPLFLTVPEVAQLRSKQQKKLKKRKEAALAAAAASGAQPAAGEAGTALVAPGTDVSSLHAFHETLRDRLIGYFENRGLTHKPKLIGVTSLGRQAGVTTTAAGLSQSLSEIGEGNVLLVDMTAGQGAAQQFIKGKAVCDIDDVLASRDDAHVQENLYVVATDSNSERLSRNLPQRFTKLVPQLKASDFDYIIFDMPPVSQISVTPRLASFMDMVLLVIESEKTDREAVIKGTSLLAESKAHVGAVLNKTRTYVPKRLHQDFLYGV